jgi:hypothetical protein
MSAVVASAAVLSADRRVIDERIEFSSPLIGPIPSRPFLFFCDDEKTIRQHVTAA